MSQRKCFITETELKKLYLEEKQPTTKIAKKCGVSPVCIWSWLKRFNIPVRSISQANTDYTIEPNELRLLYENNTRKDTIQLTGLSSTHLHRLLHKQNIPRRNNSQAVKFFYAKHPEAKKIAAHNLRPGWNKGKKGLLPAWNKGKHGIYSEATLERIRAARRKQKIVTSGTIPETKMAEIIKKNNLPYKFTGNGTFWIENINPDFVNCDGEKIALEVFGDYWHTRPGVRKSYTEEGRREILAQYGWKLIVIWEHEVDNEQLVLSKLEAIDAHTKQVD